MSNNPAGTTGGTAGQELGNKLKAGWNVIHGAGEAIRGNINDGADAVGDQIAGRNNHPGTTTTNNTTTTTGSHTGTTGLDNIGVTHTHPPTRSEGGKKPAQVAANGANEMEAGLRELQR